MSEAIDQYIRLSKTIFSATSNDSAARFDHSVFEREIKSVVTNSSLHLTADAPLKSEKAPKIFVVATSLRALGSAVRMRSYDTQTADAFHHQYGKQRALHLRRLPSFIRSVSMVQYMAIGALVGTIHVKRQSLKLTIFGQGGR